MSAYGKDNITFMFGILVGFSWLLSLQWSQKNSARRPWHNHVYLPSLHKRKSGIYFKATDTYAQLNGITLFVVSKMIYQNMIHTYISSPAIQLYFPQLFSNLTTFLAPGPALAWCVCMCASSWYVGKAGWDLGRPQAANSRRQMQKAGESHSHNAENWEKDKNSQLQQGPVGHNLTLGKLGLMITK